VSAQTVRVAILGRRGRRPLPILTATVAWLASVAILGRRGRRPLHHRPAHRVRQLDLVAILGRRGRRPLRSGMVQTWSSSMLRSSAAADGGRCRCGPPGDAVVQGVAILGRRGRRPLP